MIKTDSEPFLSFNKNSDFITGVDTENVIEYTNGDVTTYTLRLYTQTDDFNNFTNGIVKSQNGEVATYIYRYIPSAKYVIQKSLSQDDFITYDGLLQLLNTDGSLITEQEIEDGVSKRTPTGCEPSIVASGGRWRCAAGNQHPPSQCVAINPDGICDACGTEWIVWELSTVHPCSSGGGSTGNTGNNNPYGDGGGSGSGHNDNNNTNDNSSSEDNAPVLPTEPIFGSDNEMGIEDHFNQYLCLNNQMDINDINWAYGNHAEASELWNYIYANFTSNDESDCVVIDFDLNVFYGPEFANNPKLKCIYENLYQDGSSLFLETVGSFVNNPDFDLYFTIGECSNTDEACTDVSEINTTGRVTIILEEIETYPLEIAATILHEAIHAELARYVLLYESNVDINNKPLLFERYNYYYNLYDNQDGEIDHIYMTENYINPMAEALRSLDNNQSPLNYYKTIAWDGLRDWDAKNLLGNLDDDYLQYRLEVLQNSELCD